MYVFVCLCNSGIGITTTYKKYIRAVAPCFFCICCNSDARITNKYKQVRTQSSLDSQNVFVCMLLYFLCLHYKQLQKHRSDVRCSDLIQCCRCRYDVNVALMSNAPIRRCRSEVGNTNKNKENTFAHTTCTHVLFCIVTRTLRVHTHLFLNVANLLFCNEC